MMGIGSLGESHRRCAIWDGGHLLLRRGSKVWRSGTTVTSTSTSNGGWLGCLLEAEFLVSLLAAAAVDDEEDDDAYHC